MKPAFSDFPNYALHLRLIVMVGLGNMKIDGMFSYCRLELSLFAYLLGSAITYQLIWYAKVRNELLQRLTGAALMLHQVGGGKERLISKDLRMFVAI